MSRWAIGQIRKFIQAALCITGPTVYPLTGATSDTPIGIIYAAGYVWTANNVSGSVTRWDPVSHTSIAITMSFCWPIGLAYDGARIWVSNTQNANVFAIDTTTLAVSQYSTGTVGATDGIMFDNTHIWVCGFGSHRVGRFTPAGVLNGNVLLPIAARGPYGPTYFGSWIYVPCTTTNNVARISRVAIGPTPALTVVVYPLPVGATQPDWACTDHDRGQVWTCNTGSNNVTRMDFDGSNAVNFPLPVGASAPRCITYDSEYIWVSNPATSNITRIDPVTGAGQNFANGVGAAGNDGIISDQAGLSTGRLWTANPTTDNITEWSCPSILM